jgi:hypothetical protein
VALQFHVEAVAEQLCQRIQPAHGIGVLPLRERHVDGAFRTTRQADQSFEAFPAQPVELGPGDAIGAQQVRLGDQPRQVLETLLRLRHQHDAGFAGPRDMTALADPPPRRRRIDRQLDAGQRLNALLAGLSENSSAPNRLPVSAMPSAGWLSAAASLRMFSSCNAPSSSE